MSTSFPSINNNNYDSYRANSYDSADCYARSLASLYSHVHTCDYSRRLRRLVAVFSDYRPSFRRRRP